eukprot:CAMPEP_0202907534 /NCGR_PEP_ID=MMETSP1392-20130828/42958_1 /ASSEMBLY_ACC=CAM_ASM_000868 /TAXON_ID=225041 /ORGANISM="Chlamydomonas chlamydogama, Strain SAG 11-48b" /LENGTH=40 /DNA_ID= /DNA_START= /DNA_END= /DNA_ORIENTATION=
MTHSCAHPPRYTSTAVHEYMRQAPAAPWGQALHVRVPASS